MLCPTWMIRYSSISGTTTKMATSSTGTLRMVGRRQGPRHYHRGMPTVDAVEDALTNVIDPELGLDFVELGLIYEISVEDEEVFVTFSLTSPGCPIGPQVSEQIEEFVSELEGVSTVNSKMVFTPPWTPDRMSEDAKFALGLLRPGPRVRRPAGSGCPRSR